MGKDVITACKIGGMWYNPVCEVMKMAYDNALVANIFPTNFVLLVFCILIQDFSKSGRE